MEFSVLPIAGRLADGKVMYPPLFFHLPVVPPNFFLVQFVHHPCESAGRSFILTWVLLVCPPLNFFQTLLGLGGGGGYGGHTYSVCTVWATIGPGCSVVYGATRYRMHASDASSDRMAGTGSTCIYTDIEGGPRVRSE